jgi:hypothetical protein
VVLDREGSIADWTVTQLVERMRRPRYRCGGGVAACLSIAQAAALTDLVRRAAKQQLPREVADTLAEDLERIAASALAQAERDRVALDELLSALRMDQRSPSATVAAERASTVPLETADLGLALSALIRSVLERIAASALSNSSSATRSRSRLPIWGSHSQRSSDRSCRTPHPSLHPIWKQHEPSAERASRQHSRWRAPTCHFSLRNARKYSSAKSSSAERSSRSTLRPEDHACTLLHK